MIHMIQRHLAKVAMLAIAAAALSGCVVDADESEETTVAQIEVEREVENAAAPEIVVQEATIRLDDERRVPGVAVVTKPSTVPLAGKRQDSGRPTASDPPPHPW